MAKWVDAECIAVGALAFLVETLDTNSGARRWSLRDTPLRTNQSLRPRLFGWCGETDNRARTAHGLVRVARVAHQTERAQVVTLRGRELAEALATLGYPDLAPEEAGVQPHWPSACA